MMKKRVNDTQISILRGQELTKKLTRHLCLDGSLSVLDQAVLRLRSTLHIYSICKLGTSLNRTLHHTSRPAL
jgi:hypothetical protein